MRIDEESGRLLGAAEPLITPALWSGNTSIARDGVRIAYATAEPRSIIQRLAFDRDRAGLTGSPTVVVGGSRTISFHAISPDGQWIAFTSGGLRESLFVIRMDGTGYRQLIDDTFRTRGPDWSPDGTRIAFFSDRSGRYDTWSIRPDGSVLEQLTQGGNTPALSWVRWSPDGRMFLAGTVGYPLRLFQLDQPLQSREIRTLPAISSELTFAQALWSPMALGWPDWADDQTPPSKDSTSLPSRYNRTGESGALAARSG